MLLASNKWLKLSPISIKLRTEKENFAKFIMFKTLTHPSIFFFTSIDLHSDYHYITIISPIIIDRNLTSPEVASSLQFLCRALQRRAWVIRHHSHHPFGDWQTRQSFNWNTACGSQGHQWCLNFEISTS